MTDAVGHSDPLRIGIVGGGFIRTTVGVGFRDHEAARIAALVDIDEPTLDAAGAKLGVDPEARELVALNDDREPVLMVGYQRHLDPAFIRAREVWASADREPRWITATVGQQWVDRFRGTWRQNPDLSGGGYLYDTGSHLLDCILWSTRLTPDAVSATMHFIDEEGAEPRSADSRAAAPRGRVDGSASVTVRFTNGALVTVSLSGEIPCMREQIWMWDEQGAVGLSAYNWEPSEYVEVDADNGEYWPRIRRRTRRTKADAFSEAIRTGEEPVATALDGLRVTAVTEAAYESARNEGAFVGVDAEDVALNN